MHMDEKKQQLSRIQALLDKTVENGCTEQEALAASLAARKLLARYHIDENDLANDSDMDIVEVESVVTTNMPWKGRLVVIVARNFGCAAYAQCIRCGRARRNVAVIVGRPEDANLANRIIRNLIDAGKAGARRAIRDARERYGDIGGIRGAYVNGYVAGVENAFDEQTRTQAIIIVKPDAVDQRMSEKNLETKTSVTTVRRGAHDIYERGVRDGRDAAMREQSLGTEPATSP